MKFTAKLTARLGVNWDGVGASDAAGCVVLYTSRNYRFIVSVEMQGARMTPKNA